MIASVARRTRALVLVPAAAAVLAACSSSGGASTPSSGATGTSSATTAPASTAPASSSAPSSAATSGAAAGGQLYVSIGDSYAAGYQPTGQGQGRTTTNGFAYQVVSKAKAKGHDYTLVNFGCAGATTGSVLTSPGCKPNLLGPGAPSYTQPQAAAAEAYIKAHRAQVGLITVSLGGNDITSCALAKDATGCVISALGTVKTNLATLLQGLRTAAGPSVRIVGITYPDVFLGDLINGSAAAKQLAQLSVTAFKSLINPALQAAYSAAGARFADVTTATGAYEPLTDTTTLAPYGKIPVPVAKVCSLTYYCEFHDIHPRTNGYAIIADLVVGQLG
ncbi:MAG: SGNH/GDSL hydrolase family protein [Jatrophihabitans sp.]|uniref:SGNH/GDSL hydrolase family protein n=1 Tax=Jatrophihabitans sp. TaxID=1932789 RepID=UPI003F813F53